MSRKNFYTPPEAAKLLEFSTKTIYRMIAAGRIEVITRPGEGPQGTRYRIRRSELIRLGWQPGDNGKGGE